MHSAVAQVLLFALPPETQDPTNFLTKDTKETPAANTTGTQAPLAFLWLTNARSILLFEGIDLKSPLIAEKIRLLLSKVKSDLNGWLEWAY